MSVNFFLLRSSNDSDLSKLYKFLSSERRISMKKRNSPHKTLTSFVRTSPVTTQRCFG